MTYISIYKNKGGEVIGFRCEGHAGYDEYGSDIVCAAVSALVMTTMNSIEHFTSDTFEVDADEKTGMIDFKIVSTLSEYSQLLLGSLILGLSGIEKEYGHKYIKINNKR